MKKSQSLQRSVGLVGKKITFRVDTRVFWCIYSNQMGKDASILVLGEHLAGKTTFIHTLANTTAATNPGGLIPK